MNSEELARPGGMRRNVVTAFLGNIAFSGSQWAVTVAIARLDSISSVGHYALGLAIANPIFAFAGLQLRAVQATDTHGQFTGREYLMIRIAGTAAALAASAAVMTVMPWPADAIPVILAVAGLKTVESFSDLAYGFLQRVERLDLIAVAGTVRGLSGLAALATALFVFRSTAAAIVAMTCLWLLVLAVYERPLAIRGARDFTEGRRGFEWSHCRALVILCIPLALVLLLLTSATSVPRVVLERYAGSNALGVFSAAATLSAGLGVLYLAISQAALPRLAYLYGREHGAFSLTLIRLLLFGFALGVVLIAGAWFFGASALAAIYGPAAAADSAVFSGLVTISVLNNLVSLIGAGLTASRRLWPQVAAATIVLIATTVASISLIPPFGVAGAMYAGLIGASFQLLIYAYIAWRSVRNSPRTQRWAT